MKRRGFFREICFLGFCNMWDPKRHRSPLVFLSNAIKKRSCLFREPPVRATVKPPLYLLGPAMNTFPSLSDRWLREPRPWRAFSRHLEASCQALVAAQPWRRALRCPTDRSIGELGRGSSVQVRVARFVMGRSERKPI